MKDDEPRYLEVDSGGRAKRLRGWIGFIAIYLAVAGGLAALMVVFTHSWLLAIVLVGFMTGYMAIMAWLALRRAEDKDV